jgi:hypothetical protein
VLRATAPTSWILATRRKFIEIRVEAYAELTYAGVGYGSVTGCVPTLFDL